MVTALPSRIMNYRISAASPTEELVTLGQILSEVGDYMSTVLDREHLSLARRCSTRLGKVVGELIARKRIQSSDDLYAMPETSVDKSELSAMSVSELHSLYRCWPKRHNRRRALGQEHLTYYYEGRIVRELMRRKPADKNEQLKIDYCTATYANELDNMSFILSLPVKSDDDKDYLDPERNYSPEELASLIGKYTCYRDIIGREILIEYVDYALDILKTGCPQSNGCLVAAIDNLQKKDIIHVPIQR